MPKTARNRSKLRRNSSQRSHKRKQTATANYRRKRSSKTSVGRWKLKYNGGTGNLCSKAGLIDDVLAPLLKFLPIRDVAKALRQSNTPINDSSREWLTYTIRTNPDISRILETSDVGLCELLHSPDDYEYIIFQTIEQHDSFFDTFQHEIYECLQSIISGYAYRYKFLNDFLRKYILKISTDDRTSLLLHIVMNVEDQDESNLKSRVEIFKYLVEKGGNLNHSDDINNKSILWHAVNTNKVDVIMYLLTQDLHVPDNEKIPLYKVKVEEEKNMIRDIMIKKGLRDKISENRIGRLFNRS